MSLKSYTTLDEIWMCEVDADPSTSGVDAPVGSYAFLWQGDGSWRKISSSTTGWIKIANESLLRFSALSPYTLLQATSASTITLTAASNSTVIFTGATAGQILKLPNATALNVGWQYEVWNTSTQTIALQNTSGAVVTIIPAGTYFKIVLQDASTANGSWSTFSLFSSTASGIINAYLTQTATFSVSTGTADTPVTGFTLTPPQGTYLVTMSAYATYSTNSQNPQYVLSLDGSAYEPSRRLARCAGANSGIPVSLSLTMDFDGAQTVGLMLKPSSNGNTFTVTNRSFTLIRMQT